MKNFSGIDLIIVAIFMLVISMQSCTDDTNVDPNSNDRDKFLGTWTVEESCIRLNYEVEIEADSIENTKVLLYNFAFMGQEFDPAYGYASGNKVTLPQQNIGDGWKIKGNGTMQSNGTIIWTYYIEIAANGSNCQANFNP